MLNQNYELYKDTNYGFELLIPSSWEYVDNHQTIFIFIEPEELGVGFRGNVNLILNNNKGLSLREYTEVAKMQMRSQLSGYQELESNYVAINGCKMSRIIYVHNMNDIELQVFYYVLFNGGNAYNFTFSSLKDRTKILETVEKSFKKK